MMIKHLVRKKMGVASVVVCMLVIAFSLYLSGCIHREAVSNPVQPELPAKSAVQGAGANATIENKPVESKTEVQNPIKTPESEAVTRNKTVSADEAGKLIEDYVKRLPFKGHLESQEKQETFQGHTFYVFRGYEYIIDNLATGEGHQSTWGWFYIDISNGAIYQADLAEMVLKPVGGRTVPQKTIKME